MELHPKTRKRTKPIHITEHEEQRARGINTTTNASRRHKRLVVEAEVAAAAVLVVAVVIRRPTDARRNKGAVHQDAVPAEEWMK